MTFRTHFVDPLLKRRIDQLELALELVDAVLDHHKGSANTAVTAAGGVLIAAVSVSLMVLLHLGAVFMVLTIVGLSFAFAKLTTRWTYRKFQPLLKGALAQGLDPRLLSSVAWGSPDALVVQHNVWLVNLRWALYQAGRPMADGTHHVLAGDLLVHLPRLDDEQQDFVDAMLEQHGVTPIKARAWASCRKDHSRDEVKCTQCVWPGRHELYQGR